MPHYRTHNAAYGVENNAGVVGATVGTPLPSLKPQVSGTIHVQNVWDVQYSEGHQQGYGYDNMRT